MAQQMSSVRLQERADYSLGSCAVVVATIFSKFDLVLRVAVAAAAQDTACGGSSGESCRWCSGWFLVELQVELEQQNFQWNCRWTAAAIRTIFSELKCAAAWW
jgi:hypothetical protein